MSSSLLSMVLLLPFLVINVVVDAVQLSVDNFDDITINKNVFIRFCTPYNSACRALSDDWNRLEEDWSSHDVGVIANVDCSSEHHGKPICDEFDITTYPTLIVYYGDDPLIHVETYDYSTTDIGEGDGDGGLDYESLSKYAKQHLSQLRCSPLRLDACTVDERTIIENLESKTLSELNDIVTTVTDMVETEETKFDNHVKEIQQLYEKYVQEFNTKMDEIKSQYNYHFVEQIVALKSVDAAAAMDAEDELPTEKDL
jgi:Thioredoxin